MGKKADDVYTPEQRDVIKKMTVARETPEQRAKLDKGRAAIDRYIAIRDNQIPPLWAEKATTGSKAKPKSKPKKKKPGWQQRRVRPILRKLWLNGQPPADLSHKEIVARVNAIYGPLYDGHEVSRTTVFRVIDDLRKESLSIR
ncbi:hypothetical protein [Bradyrhizobium valentinum]|uniref:Uncharacterized protein n=1 Tax=Bradyrhizobium valentinum TaxID=1518501 RepID=A0A0R3M8Y3_9BRAD|nr:hypothetical protein [Bradyrhizobium valentinum]KRR14527.1 hypothetical protein CP49_25790 [Bradyrhizobium valentinum]